MEKRLGKIKIVRSRLLCRELRPILAECRSADWIFIDESGFEPDSYRRYGWRPSDHPVYEAVRVTNALAKT